MTSAPTRTGVPGAPPDDRRTVFRWVAAGIWLVYLANPASRLIQDATGWWQAVGLVALTLFVVIYLVTIVRNRGFRELAGRAPAPLWESWVRLGLLVLLTLAVVPGAGDQALTCVVFIAAAAMAALPSRPAWVWLIACFAVTELAGRLIPGWSDGGNGFAVLLAGLAVWAFRMAFVRQSKLLAAERDLGELALRAERSRIARDLHDILGHSLTVISVKTELAERMLDVDPERTRRELQDLGRLTRDALADVRSTALGVRGVSLPGEIAAARTALESAGIDAELPTVADDVPTRWRELFAWTVREGVTNVVRHSHATSCRIEMDAAAITVCDDGVGVGEASRDGQGLDGLRQRAALAGATITTGPGPGGHGFSIRLQVSDV